MINEYYQRTQNQLNTLQKGKGRISHSLQFTEIHKKNKKKSKNESESKETHLWKSSDLGQETSRDELLPMPLGCGPEDLGEHTMRTIAKTEQS